MLCWISEVERRLSKATAALTKLATADAKYTILFFEQQWARQQEVQKNVISATTRRLKERMGVLMDLEEELVEARFVLSFQTGRLSTYLIAGLHAFLQRCTVTVGPRDG